MANDNVANQLSCSWSGGNPDPAAEQIFQQMAVQGQSFFNATGDTDAFNGAIPFPSESPNITEVGGTFLVTDINGNYSAESVWNRGGDVGGSGGISPAVAIPVWQLGLDMTTNHGSTYFRNIPDVALTADNVYVFAFNQGGGVGGTSCAAPLWAALTALINQQAAQLGQPPVGFLNPALYALCRGTNYAKTFHDITTGNNTNTNSPANFFAVPGFDLCTGWGTPAGTNLINALTIQDNLGVMPPTSFSASGLVGGPFTPTNWSVTLTNSGADSLAWSLGDALAWLTVSASNGTLAAQGTTNIQLQLVNANGLSAGTYLAALLVTNQSLSRVHAVAVRLDIGPPVAFVSFSASTSAFQLAWHSVAGLNYQVQCKTNLAQAGWLNLGTVAATTNITMFADTNAMGATGQRFYRLVQLP
jgi:subtilase family serine protease